MLSAGAFTSRWFCSRSRPPVAVRGFSRCGPGWHSLLLVEPWADGAFRPSVDADLPRRDLRVSSSAWDCGPCRSCTSLDSYASDRGVDAKAGENGDELRRAPSRPGRDQPTQCRGAGGDGHDEAHGRPLGGGERSLSCASTSRQRCDRRLRRHVQSRPHHAAIGVLGVGAYLVIHQEATAGIIIAGSILTARAFAPVDLAIPIGRVSQQPGRAGSGFRSFSISCLRQRASAASGTADEFQSKALASHHLELRVRPS